MVVVRDGCQVHAAMTAGRPLPPSIKVSIAFKHSSPLRFITQADRSRELLYTHHYMGYLKRIR